MFKCPYCERENFAKLNDQREHIGEAHPGMELNRCAFCNKTYSSRNNLLTHLRRHGDQKPFVCGVCNEGFLYQSLFDRHMRTHTGERPYRCTMCDASFHRSDNLKGHMLTHTGERSHVCDQCDSQFGRAGDLRRHMRIHKVEKPYACSECDKRYHQRQHLKAHMRNHTGEKPFVCTICSEDFTHANSLTQHMKTRHPSEHNFNKALTHMIKEPQNCFSDSAQAWRYVSELFDGAAPANRYQQCPNCGESVPDLEQHIAFCPWRQGPSWQ